VNSIVLHANGFVVARGACNPPRHSTTMGLSRGNTSTFVLLVLYCGCMSGGFRIVPLQNYASSLTLEATFRVDFKVLRRCNEGGLSSKPIAVSPSVTCPCFLEYQFFPDVPSVWDVYFLAEADAVRWAATGYRDDPTSYISKYSALGVEAAGGGDGQGLQQTNVLLEGIFRLAFRARAVGTVCFSELDGTNDARPTNFYVFESIPSPCPVVVPDVSAEQRIVGGTEAAAVNGIAKYFPWIAVIWQGTRRSICGGSHIAPGYVLTAAHCQIQKDISAFNVRIGNEVYDAGQQYSISKIWVHEEYKLLDSGEAINDIAILQIKNLDPSKVNDTVVFNTNTSIPRAGQYMTTAGYGHLSEGWAAPLNPHRLRKVDVPMWSIQDCSRVFSKVDPKMHICAGVKTGGCDSCQYVNCF
jgi:Trypsin